MGDHLYRDPRKIGLIDPDHQLTGEHCYLRSEISHRIEIPVDLRRSMTLDALKAELGDTLERRTLTLGARGYDLNMAIRSPFGMKPAGWVLSRRIVDLVVHEQDILRALGQPMRLGPAAPSALTALIERLPSIVGAIDPPLSGRVRFMMTGIDAQSVQLGDSSDDRPAATITIAAQPALLLLAGRAAVNELVINIEGDEDLARAVITHAVVT